MTGPYGWLNRAEGRAECTVRGAMPAVFLSRCGGAGIPILGAEARSEDTLIVILRLRDLERAQQLAPRCQCELTVLHRRGGRMLWRRLLRRGVPALCLLLFLCLLAWSKLFIWELEVTGNETVSTARILNALADCGIRPGTFWPGYTSDNLRSELLVKLPELGWAAVNIHGSRAEVIVRERIPKPELYDADAAVDLVSDRAGFVTQVRALNGTALVKPGSAVLPGETLIAGTADSAFSGKRDTHAVGSVTAETYFELTASVPASEYVRESSGRQRSRWALEIGTKRINFYRNSSICGNECDKIRTVWQCRAEGLFSLPLALVRETFSEYSLTAQPRDANLARRELEQQLHARLLSSLSDGDTVESESYSCCLRGGSIEVCLRARCSQEISMEKPRIQEEQIP